MKEQTGQFRVRWIRFAVGCDDRCRGGSVSWAWKALLECWFPLTSPDILASGSDDTKVRIWSMECKKAVSTIGIKGTFFLWNNLIQFFFETFHSFWTLFESFQTNFWKFLHFSIINFVLANVCCVQFNPHSTFHIAFGSADHCVHYYDIRRSDRELEVFQGHKKLRFVRQVSQWEYARLGLDLTLR